MIVELNISDDTGGFVFQNVISQSDIDLSKKSIRSKIDKFEKINLYFEDDDVDEIELRAFFDQVFFDISHAESISKIAIVTNRKWIQGTSKIKNLLSSSDIKAFDSKDRVDALCWIMKC